MVSVCGLLPMKIFTDIGINKYHTLAPCDYNIHNTYRRKNYEDNNADNNNSKYGINNNANNDDNKNNKENLS